MDRKSESTAWIYSDEIIPDGRRSIEDNEQDYNNPEYTKTIFSLCQKARASYVLQVMARYRKRAELTMVQPYYTEVTQCYTELDNLG